MLTFVVFSTIVLLGAPAIPDIRVELIPSNPGPYVGGELLTVDVWLHSEMSEDGRPRQVRFDFEQTDSEIIAGPEFAFDFSSLKTAGQNPYVTDPSLPRPQTENSILCFCPDHFLLFVAGGSLHIGSLPVQLPPVGGTYRLDALNATATDWEHGGQIWVDYSPVGGIRRADTGEIVGGQFDFVVTPPPIPTVSEWGFVITGVLLLILGTLHIRAMHSRKKKYAPSRIGLGAQRVR